MSAAAHRKGLERGVAQRACASRMRARRSARPACSGRCRTPVRRCGSPVGNALGRPLPDKEDMARFLQAARQREVGIVEADRDGDHAVASTPVPPSGRGPPFALHPVAADDRAQGAGHGKAGSDGAWGGHLRPVDRLGCGAARRAGARDRGACDRRRVERRAWWARWRRMCRNSGTRRSVPAGKPADGGGRGGREVDAVSGLRRAMAGRGGCSRWRMQRRSSRRGRAATEAARAVAGHRRCGRSWRPMPDAGTPDSPTGLMVRDTLTARIAPARGAGVVGGGDPGAGWRGDCR